MFYPRIGEKSASSVVVIWIYLTVWCAASIAPCDKTRRVFTEPSGVITDGPTTSNYTQDSHCEWLIKAANKSQYITLSFIRMGTECSYDYVFVYDGDSFDAPLLGSFSGKTEPQNVTASSGYMLILLYSDTNYVLDGFRATYAIHNCPNNCTGRGLCVSHKCFCVVGVWGGPDCSVELCPNGCSGNGQCKGDGCQCKKGFSGESCSLKKNDKEGNSWHWLSHTESGMTKRAAHTAVYVNHTDSLYVFGGYDLNRVLGLLEIYKFSTSQWYNENGRVLRRYPTTEENDKSLLTLFTKGNIDGSWQIGNRSSLFNLLLASFSHNDKTTLPLMYTPTPYSESYLQFTDRPEFLSSGIKSNNSKPEPRYGHAACSFWTGFILYGGKLSDGSLSSELWYYDAVYNSWILRAVNSTFTPPGLTRHTMTAVNDELYLFGGSTVDGEFSSSLYKIKLGEVSSESWEKVQVRGGKELDVRVVSHTTVYHSHSNSLLVYGGVVASVARFSKLSDRMFAFDLDYKHWSEIHYPRAHLRDTYVPRERAFHTATLIGNYLVVFGGYSHRHNREEICYDGQMYLYHLGCHAWIPLDVLGKTRKIYPKKQGVFAHAAALKPPSTLLIVGGYHGNVNGDLLAYVVPSWHAGITNKDPESACPKHRSQPECLADPECGWCSADDICYGRTIGSNCTTNLQSIRCGGICPALGDCHSCLIHGPPLEKLNTTRKPLPSVSTKLGLYQCSWCVQNARCHHKDDNYGVCGEDTPSENPGWWGNTGTEVTTPEECKILDKRPGLTFLRYQQPADWNHPDGVSVVNATTVDWGTGGGSNHIFVGSSEARLRGWLHIPQYWNGTGETLHICAGHSNISLNLGDKPVSVANLTAQPSACSLVDWPALFPGRLSVDMHANDSLHTGLYPSHHHSKMELLHNKSQENAKVFTFEFLEPYSDGQCSNYDNCLLCLSDAACGWCEVTNRCEARNTDEKTTCSADGEWRYLTLQPAACPNCSNYISCERCVSGNYCEWWADEARCSRRGRAGGAVVDAGECPAPCRLRLDCDHCLDERGRCVWCEATRQCFSFSVYTSEYQFGLCREWLDRASAPPTDDAARKSGQCKSCQAHTQCATCLRSMGCGWCHSFENPINGICTEGDFTRSHVDCASLLNVTSTDAGWAYAQCPDVDECGLGLHDCHEHAICNNTHGSYTCKCKQGYIGDGKKSCMRTCYNNCVHGYCGGAPQYKCHCDLGWTGADCSINCGCHNHSTCKTGVGRCDECKDWTEGEFCESCKPGSHGNATTGQGCRRCDCNDHGDEARGVCDYATGECICKDNTEGQNCERCKAKFYGDPRHGGRCYYQCEPRGMLNATQTEGIGSFMTDPDVSSLGPSKECLWIISASNIKDATIQFRINSSHFDVPCDENAVYVYDGLGGVPDLNNNQQSQLLGVFCNGASSGVVEARSGNLTVHYKQGQTEQGFEGVYEVLACDDYCSWPRLCNKRHCVCRDGYGGPNCDIEICRNNCSETMKAGVCDTSYGRCLCNEGFGGDDCSVKLDKTQLVFTELFNSEFLSDSLDHLRKTLPRFGHSLVADRRGLWMFGGYSLSHGPLNDIRFFDTKNNTWMQVTVEATPDAKMPERRYFHAAEIYHSKQNIYIYGGLSLQEKSGENKILDDFWQFSLKDQRWSNIKSKNEKPPALAGHTLTLQKYQDYESLVLIGGFSMGEGFMSEIWEFDLDNEKWIKLECRGSMPSGVIGHSTVYHAPSQSLYVFGGILYVYNGTMVSDKLFSFHYPTKTWSELPSYLNLHNAFDSLPLATYLHSAVTTNDYMIVFGGRTEPENRSNALIAYVYECNQWVRLVKGVSIVDHPPPRTIAHAMAIDVETDSEGYIYIIGGWTGSANCQVTRISLPEDLCSLWSSNKLECRSHMGCSFCSTSNYTKCFSVNKPGCEGSDRVSTNSGAACDFELISSRSCENFTTCTSCLAAWPLYPEEKPACRWCESCAAAVGECVPTDESCTSIKCNAGTTYISDVDQCPELRCLASDCDKCVSNQCTWTRYARRAGQETKIVEENSELFNWTCALIDEPGRASLRPRTKEECPSRCNQFTDCQSCLSSDGAEGGFSECHWASYLGTCISPAYQPIICAGGVCGLVLTKADKNKCPAPCDTFEQCSECLRHSHCGWCALEDANGEGVCSEGSIESPLDYTTRTTCAAVYATLNQSNNTNETFSWHYTRCPPENECENNHHQCKAESEVCVDLPEGYECACGAGYKRAVGGVGGAGGGCAAVCSQGCVRGACVQPNDCRCDFGYVGANCTIQCQCNGHSHCEGPDKLDKCIECHNNTMGNQCEICKPNFVGDPTDNGQCIPCSVYCHGHTTVCTSDVSEGALAARDPPPDDDYYREGSKARCVRCANSTDGLRCERCIEGYFRGSEDFRDPCRPCECHGHGDTCDPVSGEKCNCGNNTESDASCQAAGASKNSAQECWRYQCVKCRDLYMGDPRNGHQCYKTINIENKLCFDGKSIDECKIKPRPLYPGQTVFVAVNPRYMNVDIRVIVDVTQGAVDLYLSPNDSSFVVSVNSTTGAHAVELDPTYYKHDQFRKIPSLDDPSPDYQHLTWYHDKTEISLADYAATELATYVSVDKRNVLLRVRNLRNRLVLTLPEKVHDLSHTKFYIIIHARPVDDGAASFGITFFRQDQLHIDLFVFFSVFFSCFFLFLAACVVAWKAKQAADVRRARRRHVVEMLHMAKRPFAVVRVVLSGGAACAPGAAGGVAGARRRRALDLRPVAIEPTGDARAAVTTVLVRLPGGARAPVRMALGSALVLVSRNPAQRPRARPRRPLS